MTELERQLQRLAAAVDWPPTPGFSLRAPRPRRWPFVLVVAAALAVGLAFAVPQSRGALLRFFHVGAARVERVDTLPPAAERSLRASLGTPISGDAARVLLGARFSQDDAELYRSGPVVSALVETSPPLLLSELLTGQNVGYLKKFAAGASEVKGVAVTATTPGLWLYGGRHVFIAPPLPPRYAGNTLLWQDGGITFRLEGRSLTLEHALAVARRLAKPS